MASRIEIRAFRHRVGAQARCAIETYRSLCLLSVLRIYLWCLFANFPRIDDEFERIRVLILFHQLQIDEPLSAFYRIATGKLRLCGFDQIRCHRILPVCRKTIRCCDDLRLREAWMVNET